MEYNVAVNNYIVVTPKGTIKGFLEEEEAHMYVLGYYEKKVNKLSDDRESIYEDYATEPLESTIGICIDLGVTEGDCTIYDLDDFIEKIQESSIFEDEKEELILKLMKKDIRLNAVDYQLMDILRDVKVIPHR